MWGVEFYAEWILQILRAGLWANREEGPRGSNAPVGPVVLSKAVALSDLSERVQPWKGVLICLSPQCSTFQQHLLYLGMPGYLREPMDSGQVDVESSEDLASFLYWFAFWGSAALTTVSTLVGGICHAWVKNCSDDHIFTASVLRGIFHGSVCVRWALLSTAPPAVPNVLSFSVCEMKMCGLDGQQVTLNSNLPCFQTIHVEVGKMALGYVTTEWNLISGDKDEDSIIRCSSMARDTCLVWGQVSGMLERGAVLPWKPSTLWRRYSLSEIVKKQNGLNRNFVYLHIMLKLSQFVPFFVVKSN